MLVCSRSLQVENLGQILCVLEYRRKLSPETGAQERTNIVHDFKSKNKWPRRISFRLTWIQNQRIFSTAGGINQGISQGCCCRLHYSSRASALIEGCLQHFMPHLTCPVWSAHRKLIRVEQCCTYLSRTGDHNARIDLHMLSNILQ